MKKACFVLCVSLLLLGACSSNKLARYEFRDTTAAARTFMPPGANVFTDLDVRIDPGDLLGSALRVGTSVAREIEAERARDRLDSAMAKVDVPGITEERVLFQAAEMLGFHPVNEVEAADFVFTVDMKRYGIDASSWDAGTFFVVEARIELIDNAVHRRIWRGNVSAREPLSPRFFELERPLETVLDAVALSELSVDEMVTGLSYLAEYSAGLITEKLYRDYLRKHR